ncbi:hypothetical protein B0H94_105125 [Salsuginibacillus halophilus]|uniref:Uncharacterized protein n=1 Tax=Salsuginibacillus halophilus TaxID=517424 RepID=A0A2P8HL69_9BACI|nr:hypothetical protein [Salsuginibacillus halophilus]PSL46972.1 hypothetical protein B0H94_105125 [Salsuginibacillus halophilus]
MLNILSDYFQPRSKIKDEVRVIDTLNNDDTVDYHDFHFFQFSNVKLLEEINLGAKSLLKQSLKEDLLNGLEFNGYVQTMNSLLNDMVQIIDSELPLYAKQLDADAIIKLLGVDFELSEDNSYDFVSKQLLAIFPVLKTAIKKQAKKTPVLVYHYPENLLSPREQVAFKAELDACAAEMKIIVLTKSRYFLADEVHGNNVIANGKQVITHSFLESLRWHAPLDYGKDELEEALTKLLKAYAMNLETVPVISNYEIADIHVFRDVDIYVLVYLLAELQFKFKLDLDYDRISAPISKYVQRYEKFS